MLDNTGYQAISNIRLSAISGYQQYQISGYQQYQYQISGYQSSYQSIRSCSYRSFERGYYHSWSLEGWSDKCTNICRQTEEQAMSKPTIYSWPRFRGSFFFSLFVLELLVVVVSVVAQVGSLVYKHNKATHLPNSPRTGIHQIHTWPDKTGKIQHCLLQY